MEKTTSHLNSKIWYRTIKVLFIFIFLISLVGFNAFVFSGIGFKNLDNNKTKIICNYKDKKNFTPKEKNIYLENYNFKNNTFDYKYFFEGYSNEYEIKDILENCYDTKNISNLDVFAIQRTYEIAGTSVNKKDYDENYLKNEINKITTGYKTNSEKSSYLDYSIKLFTIDPAFTYSKFLTFFIVGNLSILLFFEIIRRVFYYIILGTIKPKK
jgi:hypothetical protein